MKNTKFNSVKRVTRTISIVLAALCVSPFAIAQKDLYPSKPVKVLVPATPGGMSDTIARLVAEELRKELGQTVFVENQPGASGMIAARNLSRAEPDGYTIGIGYTAFLTAPVVSTKGVQYHPIKDFTPLSQLSDSVGVIVASTKSPYKNWKEFYESSIKDGKSINLGIPGYGSSPHFYTEAIAQKTGLKLNLIPYRGDVPIITEVLGDTLNLGVVTPVAAKPLIESGRLRALAITNPKRSPALPGVPTIGELGLPTLGGATTWIGVFAPAKTPENIVNTLSAIFQKMMQKPEIAKQFVDGFGMTPVGSTSAEFKAMLERDYANWIQARDNYKIKAEE